LIYIPILSSIQSLKLYPRLLKGEACRSFCHEELAKRALDLGVRIVQFREKKMNDREKLRIARNLRELTDSYDALLIIKIGAKKSRALAWDEWASLNSSVLKRSGDALLQKEVQICVVGKVFRPNKSKVLALNKTLSKYFKLVKWYLGCNSASKKFLHEKCYEKAKELFKLNTAFNPDSKG